MCPKYWCSLIRTKLNAYCCSTGGDYWCSFQPCGHNSWLSSTLIDDVIKQGPWPRDLVTSWPQPPGHHVIDSIHISLFILSCNRIGDPCIPGLRRLSQIRTVDDMISLTDWWLGVRVILTRVIIIIKCVVSMQRTIHAVCVLCDHLNVFHDADPILRLLLF